MREDGFRNGEKRSLWNLLTRSGGMAALERLIRDPESSEGKRVLAFVFPVMFEDAWSLLGFFMEGGRRPTNSWK